MYVGTGVGSINADDSTSDTNIGLIVGLVAGGLALATLILAGIFIYIICQRVNKGNL